jgi:hypothetical protein
MKLQISFATFRSCLCEALRMSLRSSESPVAISYVCVHCITRRWMLGLSIASKLVASYGHM